MGKTKERMKLRYNELLEDIRRQENLIEKLKNDNPNTYLDLGYSAGDEYAFTLKKIKENIQDKNKLLIKYPNLKKIKLNEEEKQLTENDIYNIYKKAYLVNNDLSDLPTLGVGGKFERAYERIKSFYVDKSTSLKRKPPPQSIRTNKNETPLTYTKKIFKNEKYTNDKNYNDKVKKIANSNNIQQLKVIHENDYKDRVWDSIPNNNNEELNNNNNNNDKVKKENLSKMSKCHLVIKAKEKKLQTKLKGSLSTMTKAELINYINTPAEVINNKKITKKTKCHYYNDAVEKQKQTGLRPSKTLSQMNITQLKQYLSTTPTKDNTEDLKLKKLKKIEHMKKVRSMIGKKGKMKSETLKEKKPKKKKKEDQPEIYKSQMKQHMISISKEDIHKLKIKKEKKPKKKKKEDIHKLGNQPGMYKSTHSEDIKKKEENNIINLVEKFNINYSQQNINKDYTIDGSDNFTDKYFKEKDIIDELLKESKKVYQLVKENKILFKTYNTTNTAFLRRVRKARKELLEKKEKEEPKKENGKDPDDDIIISEGESSSDEEGDTVEKFGETWTIRNEEGEKVKNSDIIKGSIKREDIKNERYDSDSDNDEIIFNYNLDDIKDKIKIANTLKDLDNVENEINESGVKNGALRSLTKLIDIREKEIKNKPKPTNKRKLKVKNINHGSNKVNLKERSKTQNIKDLKLYKDSYDILLKRRLKNHFNPKVLLSQKNNFRLDNIEAVLKSFKSTIEIISKENISLESKEYNLKYSILNLLFNDLSIIIYILYHRNKFNKLIKDYPQWSLNVLDDMINNVLSKVIDLEKSKK